MENKEYLSEEQYQKNNAKVKKIGKYLLIAGGITLVVGLILTILGFTVFGNTAASSISDPFSMSNTTGGIFGGFGLMAAGGFLDTIGFGLAIAGGVAMLIAHRREITAYTTQQVMPVASEGIKKIAPAVGSAAKEISKGIKEGINEADSKKEE